MEQTTPARKVFVKNQDGAVTKKLDQLEIEKRKAEYMEPVKVLFRFHECPGGMIKFYDRKYKGDIEEYTLFDQHVYTLPRGLVRSRNKLGRIPVYDYIPGDASGTKQGFGGGKILKVTSYKQRYGFESVDFIDSEDYRNSSVVSAEYY